jgi:hypothetical protein
MRHLPECLARIWKKPLPMEIRSNSCDALALFGHRNAFCPSWADAHMTSARRLVATLTSSIRVVFASAAPAAPSAHATATRASGARGGLISSRSLNDRGFSGDRR